MTSFCSHDLNDGIEVVSTGRMDWDAGRLVDDNHVVVFVDDTNRLSGHRRFVTV